MNDTQLTNLEAKIDKGFESVNKKFESVNQRFDNVDKKFIELHGEIKLIKSDITWLKWILGFAVTATLTLLTILVTLAFK